MINIHLSHIQCDEETDEVGLDAPYVLVAAAALTPAGLPAQAPVASDVLVYHFQNMRTGGRPRFGRFESFWGIGGGAARLADPEEAIFVVAMNENDDGDPYLTRGLVDTAVNASLVTSLALPRAAKVTTLMRDIDSARRIPTGALNFDDVIGGPQELLFSADELRRAEVGETVTKTMVFRGDGGQYTLKFDAVGVPQDQVGRPIDVTTMRVQPTGLIYAVQEAGLDPVTGRRTGGHLLWYRHRGWRSGSSSWADGPKEVGNRWEGFKQVFSGGDGVLYAIEETTVDPTTGRFLGGRLLWYRHEGRADGSFVWAARSGRPVGNGWNFQQVFSGGDGVIYALQADGELLWYRHEGREDGTNRWAASSGVHVSGGIDFQHMFAGGEGVIYGVERTGFDPTTGRRTGGRLLWMRYTGWQNGSGAWEGPRPVGTRWDQFLQVFAGRDGVIYGILENGDLLWYRHEGREDGSGRWAARSGTRVGNGWNFKQVFGG